MDDKKNPAVFRIVKSAPGQPIRAYKRFSGEIGAELDSESYILQLAEVIGNPVGIFTRKQMLERLQEAARAIQIKMQESTSSVAGVKVNQPND